MKVNTHPFRTAGLASGLIAALVFLSASPRVARAEEQMKPMKGGEHLMMLNIKTRAEAEALKADDTVAMVCSKCKSVMVHNVSTEKGHIQIMTVGSKHTCPGCNATITVVGTGKEAKDVVKHSCSKCGDDSVFCCATKPGSGATKGMEKK
jgi:hypothetical protein